MILRKTSLKHFLLALLEITLLSMCMFIASSWYQHGIEFSYLVFNLALSWVPVILSVRLVFVLRYKLWSSWEALGLSALWLIFLPNAFYMVSDYIHLYGVSQSTIVYDAVMFSTFIFTSLILGFISLYLIHLEMNKRFSKKTSTAWVAIIIFIISAAIYAGRDLRWNSWNVFTNPGGLIFDISDRLLRPEAYPQMLLTIGIFFIFIYSTYNLLWRGALALGAET